MVLGYKMDAEKEIFSKHIYKSHLAGMVSVNIIIVVCSHLWLLQSVCHIKTVVSLSTAWLLRWEIYVEVKVKTAQIFVFGLA